VGVSVPIAIIDEEKVPIMYTSVKKEYRGKPRDSAEGGYA